MRLVLLIISFVALAYFATQRFIHPQLNHNSISDRIQHPLDKRLRYKIGNIDPRFNLTHEQLKEITQQATDIWFKGTAQQLFVYDPNAQLTINLIYDHRQFDSELRSSEIAKLEQSKSIHDSEYQKLNQFESALLLEQREIEREKSEYQYRLEQYNNEVRNFNQSPHQGNSMRSYLQDQKIRLQEQSHQLQAKLDAYNENVAKINQQVDNVNQMNAQFNQSVNHFNERFQARQFDKGLFNGREINIYEFRNIDDLRLTLAHELGHGLGILHTNDPESLMYPILEKQNFENFNLRAADLELLRNR